MQMLKHNHIVGLVDILEVDANCFATVLDYCEGGDLDTLLREHTVSLHMGAWGAIAREHMGFVLGSCEEATHCSGQGEHCEFNACAHEVLTWAHRYCSQECSPETCSLYLCMVSNRGMAPSPRRCCQRVASSSNQNQVESFPFCRHCQRRRPAASLARL